MPYCFKYRIYPDQSQRETLDSAFEACRLLYNGCLEERIAYYKKFQKGISYNEQSAQLPEIKEQGWFVGIYSQTIQEVLKRLDKAFQAFFKRVKAGEAPGFPRFKKYGRFRSIVFPQPNPELKGPGGISLHGKKLKVFGIEKLIPVKLHGPLPEGAACKQARIFRDGDQYFVIFTFDGERKIQAEPTGNVAAFDLGTSSFLTKDDGTKIDHPRPFKRAKDKLIKAQRDFSAKKRNSKNSLRAKRSLAAKHRKVRNIRLDFQHKLALELVRQNDVIILEDLDVKNMLSKKKKKKVSESESSQEIDSNSQSELRQNISDAAWGQFCLIVAYKAENAGKLLVKIDPRNTSKMCSNCGSLKEMPLKERRYQCSHCGLDLDRDHNAALNIKKSGLGFVEGLNPKQKPPPQLPFGQ